MNIRKIVFFKPGAIGDFLHTLPALAELRKQFPTAHVTVVISPGIDALVKDTPVADEIIVFDKEALKKRFSLFLNFALVLRRGQYDLFIDMQGSLRSLLIRTFTRARRTLVYRKQKKMETGERRLHAVENFIATIAPLGMTTTDVDIDLPLRSDARSRADDFLCRSGLTGDRAIIALNCSVGAARPARNWLPERFAILADRLISELGANIVFVGGNEDKKLVAQIMSGMSGQALSAAGKLTLPETAALLARCRCLVSSDTGPLHLATAVGTPVVGLFGSTDPDRTGPIGQGHIVIVKRLSCVPCEEKECPLGTGACMEAISVDDVFNAVRKMLL